MIDIDPKKVKVYEAILAMFFKFALSTVVLIFIIVDFCHLTQAHTFLNFGKHLVIEFLFGGSFAFIWKAWFFGSNKKSK